VEGNCDNTGGERRVDPYVCVSRGGGKSGWCTMYG